MAGEKEYDYSAYEEGSRDEDRLAELTRLAARMAQEASEVARCESELKTAQAALRITQEEELPDLMEQLGLRDFTTESGLVIRVKTNVFGSLPKDPEKRVEALGWLEAQGYERLIKDSFNLDFDKGDHERAEALRSLLETAGYRFSRKMDVHHSTLKAFVRELLRDGNEVPMDLLGVYERKFAEIK